MRKFYIIVLLFTGITTFGQHNFLGKSEQYIRNFFKPDKNYYLKIDTLSQDNILLTFKSLYQYPYYTYEMDLNIDECISYGIVSKNKEVLGTYFDLLNYIGIILKKDTTNNTIVYEINKNGIIRYYDIKQPYLRDENFNRRSLFYILVRQKKISNGDY
jgi:hypothetical protein